MSEYFSSFLPGSELVAMFEIRLLLTSRTVTFPGRVKSPEAIEVIAFEASEREMSVVYWVKLAGTRDKRLPLRSIQSTRVEAGMLLITFAIFYHLPFDFGKRRSKWSHCQSSDHRRRAEYPAHTLGICKSTALDWSLWLKCRPCSLHKCYHPSPFERTSLLLNRAPPTIWNFRNYSQYSRTDRCMLVISIDAPWTACSHKLLNDRLKSGRWENL